MTRRASVVPAAGSFLQARRDALNSNRRIRIGRFVDLDRGDVARNHRGIPLRSRASSETYSSIFEVTEQQLAILVPREAPNLLAQLLPGRGRSGCRRFAGRLPRVRNSRVVYGCFAWHLTLPKKPSIGAFCVILDVADVGLAPFMVMA